LIINPYIYAVDLGPFSYSNTGGNGNRTAIITATTTGGLAAGTIPTIVNGSFAASTAGGFRWTNGQSSLVIHYDFGVGHAPQIDQFKFTQSAAGFSSGTWQWEFSDDDSSWTVCSATQVLNTTVVTWDATVIGSHRYYRRRQVSGTTSSGPWQEEDEFRIRGY
jgi:hypothetical protein